jgi:hypothetical protein
VLEQIALATGVPAPGPEDVAVWVETIDSTLTWVRSSGLQVYLDNFKRALASSGAEAEEVETSIRAAADPATRRAALNAYLEQAPDDSSDREQAILDSYVSGAELELSAMAARGVRENEPLRYAAAEAMLRGAQ